MTVKDLPRVSRIQVTGQRRKAPARLSGTGRKNIPRQPLADSPGAMLLIYKEEDCTVPLLAIPSSSLLGRTKTLLSVMTILTSVAMMYEQDHLNGGALAI